MTVKKKSVQGGSKVRLTPLEKIRRKMGRCSHDWEPMHYLDLGPDLNNTMGDPDRGLAYGKIVEITGDPSNGKTALCIDIAAAAQDDGAYVVWGDIENSFDQPELPDEGSWYTRRGLACHRGNKKKGVKPAENFTLLQPYIATIKGEAEERLTTGAELLSELEQIVRYNHTELGIKKQIVVVDSVAAILTEAEAEAGLDGQNLSTGVSLPKFMGTLMKRWVALMQNYNCIVLMCNQLRQKPMAFGDPNYAPGGNAVPFYAHVRIRLRRGEKGGKIQNGGKTTGVKGTISNLKNKAGGIQHERCLYFIYFDGRSKFKPYTAKPKDS